MFVRIKSILFMSATLLLAPLAQAAPKMDTNGDGEITRIEYMSFRSNSFNKQDKNFDGKLSKKEIQEARAEGIREQAKKRFKATDENGDGHITEAELGAATSASFKPYEQTAEAADKWFDNMDSDKNGNISRLEYNGFRETQMEKVRESRIKATQKRFKRMDFDGDGIITESEFTGKSRKAAAKKADTLKGLYPENDRTAKPKKRTRRDSNGDGDITKREDREYNEYQFDRMDKNKDGSITEKEASYLFADGKTIQRILRH